MPEGQRLPSELQHAPVAAGAGRSLAAEAAESNCTDPSMPQYFIRTQPPATPKAFFGHPELNDVSLSRGFAQQLEANPCRTEKEEQADFIFLCCWVNPGQVTEFLALPARSPKQPYVLFVGLTGAESTDKIDELARRRDLLFLAQDQRVLWQLQNDKEALPGATIAPANFFAAFPHDRRLLDSPPRYFLTFRGAANAIFNNVRLELRDSFRAYYASSNAREDVKMCVDPLCTPDFPAFGPMMDSAFILCPRGHGRWSYRLSEVMGACAIPVIMSDGLTLPFEPLINWKEFSIRLPERMAKGDTQDIIDRLPRDFETIRRMRRRSCEVNSLYFETERKRLEGAVKSVKAYLQDLGGERLEPAPER